MPCGRNGVNEIEMGMEELSLLFPQYGIPNGHFINLASKAIFL